jgi:hypothetical protein
MNMLEHDAVRNAWVVAAQRVAVHMLGQQRRELVPQGCSKVASTDVVYGAKGMPSSAGVSGTKPSQRLLPARSRCLLGVCSYVAVRSGSNRYGVGPMRREANGERGPNGM